jgi:outer membrane lipoprotein SlyB
VNKEEAGEVVDASVYFVAGTVVSGLVGTAVSGLAGTAVSDLVGTAVACPLAGPAVVTSG